MENPRCMDDVPITTSFISIHRRFRIAMFDDQPQSVIDNTTSKPAIGHLSVPPLSQPCRCSLSSACACAAQGWLCFNSWRKWDMLKHWGSSLGHFHSFCHIWQNDETTNLSGWQQGELFSNRPTWPSGHLSDPRLKKWHLDQCKRHFTSKDWRQQTIID
jgi:hypothetical protein